MDSREEVACPACGEMILATAKKCKHCAEWLRPADTEIYSGGVPTDSANGHAMTEAAPTTVNLRISPATIASPETLFPLVDSEGALLGGLRIGKVLSVPLSAGEHRLRFGISPNDSIVEVSAISGEAADYWLLWNAGWTAVPITCHKCGARLLETETNIFLDKPWCTPCFEVQIGLGISSAPVFFLGVVTGLLSGLCTIFAIDWIRYLV